MERKLNDYIKQKETSQKVNGNTRRVNRGRSQFQFELRFVFSFQPAGLDEVFFAGDLAQPLAIEKEPVHLQLGVSIQNLVKVLKCTRFSPPANQHTHARTHVPTNARTHTRMKTQTYTERNARTHPRTHERTHAHTNARTHAHTRMKTQTYTNTKERTHNDMCEVHIRTGATKCFPKEGRANREYL